MEVERATQNPADRLINTTRIRPDRRLEIHGEHVPAGMVTSIVDDSGAAAGAGFGNAALSAAD